MFPVMPIAFTVTFTAVEATQLFIKGVAAGTAAASVVKKKRQKDDTNSGYARR